MKKILSLTGFLLLAACSTPDLSGFAKQTATLSALTEAELTETIGAYKETKSADLKSVKNSAKLVSASLKAMVGYSDALRSLAASGENGAEAAKTAFGHIDTLSTTLKSFGGFGGFGLAGTAVQTVKTATTKIAAFVQAQQANNSLRDVTAKAQPAIDGMRDIVVAVFSYCKDQGLPPCDKGGRSSGSPDAPEGKWVKEVIATTESQIQNLQTEIIATAKLLKEKRNDFYRAYHQELVELEKSERGTPAYCVGPEECIDPNIIKTIERLDARRIALAPELTAYEAKAEGVFAWQKNRLKNGPKVVKVAAAWAREHEKVVAALQECQFNIFSCRPVDAMEMSSILHDALE